MTDLRFTRSIHLMKEKMCIPIRDLRIFHFSFAEELIIFSKIRDVL